MTHHKHDCKMAFGRKDSSCPRCVELINGAPARTNPKFEYLARRKQEELRTLQAIKDHCCTTSRCSVVCTAFEF